MIRRPLRRAVLTVAALAVAGTSLTLGAPIQTASGATATTSSPATTAASSVATAPPVEDASLTPAGSAFTAVTPQRVMAPRVVHGGTAYTLRLTGVPTGATAVALNLTLAKVPSRTYVSACPGGTPVATCRTTSTLNAEAGENVANHVVVALGGVAGDEVVLFVEKGSPTLIADLQGWYAPTGAMFSPVPPQRVMAPRVVAGGTAHTLRLTGVPAGATAVALNLTVAKVPSRTYVSACPGGTPVAACRTTSTVNADAGENVANHAVVGLGGAAGDEVVLFVEKGSPTLIVDLQGWFAPTGATFRARAPQRVMAPQVVPGGTAHTLQLERVPAGATAVALNLTVAKVPSRTYVSACPGGTPVTTCRTTSTVNAEAGENVANHVVVPLTPANHGQVLLYVERGSPTLIADVQGWYTHAVADDIEVDGASLRVQSGDARAVELALGDLSKGELINVHVTMNTAARDVGLRSQMRTLEGDQHLGWLDSRRTQHAWAKDGPHWLVLEPVDAWSDDFTVTVSRAVTTAASVDGAPLEVPALRPGQHVLVDVGHLATGQRVNVHLDIPVANSPVKVSSIPPPGGAVSRLFTAAYPAGFGSLVGAADGRHRLWLMLSTSPHRFALTLSTPRPTVPVTVDGDPADLSGGRPGQEWTGAVGSLAAGTVLNPWVDGSVSMPSTVVDLLDEAGTRVAGTTTHGPARIVVPASGRYTLRIQGPGDRLWLSTPAQLGRIAVDGQPMTLPAARPGQQRVVTVAAQAGTRIGFHVARPEDQQDSSVELFDPTGALVAMPWWSGSTGSMTASWIARSTGDHVLVVTQHNTRSVEHVLTASPMLAFDLAADGEEHVVGSQVPGQVVEVRVPDPAPGTRAVLSIAHTPGAPRGGLEGYDVTGEHILQYQYEPFETPVREGGLLLRLTPYESVAGWWTLKVTTFPADG